MGTRLQIRWRNFPLEQVNSSEEDWFFWEQPEDGPRSLRAFLAAEAVRDQGDEVFRDFAWSLLQAVHVNKMPLHLPATLDEAIQSTPGLDGDRLRADMQRPELRQRIADDYRMAVDRYGIFGTPTYLFADGDPLFVKMTPPAAEDAVELLRSFEKMSQKRPYLQELKKPRRPE